MALVATVLRRWVVVVVGAPVVGWLLIRLSRTLERRRGSSRATRGIRRGGERLRDLPRRSRRRRRR